MNIVARLKEIERRGLLGRLSSDKQARWAEYKRRHPEEFAPLKMTPELRRKAEILAQGLRPQTSNLDVIAAGAKGALEGGLVGTGKVLSGATFGASDWLDRKTGGHLARLAADVQQDADTAGIGGLNRATGFGLELGGNLLGAGGALAKGLTKAGLRGLKLAGASGGLEGLAYGATGSDNASDLPANMALGGTLGAGMGAAMPLALKPVAKLAQPLTNRVTQYFGKRNLAGQFQKGADFTDVNLGNMDDSLVNDINRIRNAGNVSPLESSRVSVPADRMQHIYEERILGNKYTPQETAEVLDKALFSKNSKVTTGNFPHLQVVYDGNNPANAAVIGKHRDTGDIFVKSSMKKDLRALDGRSFPSYTVDETSISPSPQQLRLSGFQSSYGSNVSSLQPDVKPFEKRSFIEALADRDKARIMRNGVLSGASDLSERARILQDNLARRKDGWYDPDFEQLLKTPEMAKAEVSYAQFMNQNGSKTLSPEKAAVFYENHPIAKDVVAEMREVDPRAFDNIAQGSLAEFDMLKKILREEAGNKIKVGASKSGALKRAENSLKELMNSEFPGFKKVNAQYASAQTAQDLFESKLRQGLTSVGGGTANTSPFWSGISSPLTAAGVVGGYFNPVSLAITAAGLGGKALMRNSRRAAARRLADGIVQTVPNVNPALAAGLTPTVLNNIRFFQNQ